jgi:hypothetical protein
MYCTNCGAELELPNQKFCQECGAEQLANVPVSQAPPKIDMSQYAIPPASQAPQSYSPAPSATIQTKFGSSSNMYSKRSLGFALPSFLLAIISLLIFPAFTFYPMMYGYGSVVGIIPIVLVIHGLGLAFGIVAVVNGVKARNLEPDNGMEKAGNAFGILGIIFNSLALFTSLIVGILPFAYIPYF